MPDCTTNPPQAKIQALYSTHRVARNGQQREKFLSPDFRELIIDPFLLRIENPHIEPNFSDPRFCCVLWARPPEHVIRLAARLQAMLKEAAPSRCCLAVDRGIVARFFPGFPPWDEREWAGERQHSRTRCAPAATGTAIAPWQS